MASSSAWSASCSLSFAPFLATQKLLAEGYVGHAGSGGREDGTWASSRKRKLTDMPIDTSYAVDSNNYIPGQTQVLILPRYLSLIRVSSDSGKTLTQTHPWWHHVNKPVRIDLSALAATATPTRPTAQHTATKELVTADCSQMDNTATSTLHEVRTADSTGTVVYATRDAARDDDDGAGRARHWRRQQIWQSEHQADPMWMTEMGQRAPGSISMRAVGALTTGSTRQAAPQGRHITMSPVRQAAQRRCPHCNSGLHGQLVIVQKPAPRSEERKTGRGKESVRGIGGSGRVRPDPTLWGSAGRCR
ncbi:hypothetical protein B0H14DRAFT_2587270 [Mycena olivaceomarginata]|nr:hypothetical protein B0H14DRAFT_2587270 [Mycena olivaceomarginata]